MHSGQKNTSVRFRVTGARVGPKKSVLFSRIDAARAVGEVLLGTVMHNRAKAATIVAEGARPPPASPSIEDVADPVNPLCTCTVKWNVDLKRFDLDILVEVCACFSIDVRCMFTNLALSMWKKVHQLNDCSLICSTFRYLSFATPHHFQGKQITRSFWPRPPRWPREQN